MTNTSRRSTETSLKRAAFGTAPAGYDADIYGEANPDDRYRGYSTEVVDEDENDLDGPRSTVEELGGDHDPNSLDLSSVRKPGIENITAPQHYIDEIAEAADRSVGQDERDVFRKYRAPTIVERQSEYHLRRFNRSLSPPRDSMGNSMTEKAHSVPTASEMPSTTEQTVTRRKRRWDVGPDANHAGDISNLVNAELTSARSTAVDSEATRSDVSKSKRKSSRWDIPDPTVAPRTETLHIQEGLHKPVGNGIPRTTSRWDETPLLPVGDSRRSRWDETPDMKAAAFATSSSLHPNDVVAAGVAPELLHASRWQADLEERNKPFSDAELDELLPSDGFTILSPPSSYVPVRTPARKLVATPAPLTTPLYSIPAEGGISKKDLGIPAELPDAIKGMQLKPEDYTNFAKVLDKDVNEAELPLEEQRERKIMRLLLKIKNGTPPTRKVALRQITDRAREFGAGPLFNQILPLLMSPTLEDQERHLYVKVISRILFRLDDLVRPYVHKILVVIQPLLIDEDYYARVEGREIISNLAKAAGCATMIATMRPDIDNPDEYVRNTTARAFAVVASALGIPSLLLFLKAVCRSKKSWYARHTGTKIVQQIAILTGFGCLPHLKSLVEIVAPGLTDDQAQVRTVTALALAALAEASAPFGIESFESVLKPLWQGIRLHRSKTLAAFLKATGCVIPLMDAEYASYYAREVNAILIREFQSPDDDMKKIVLKVVKQCVACEGVQPEYVLSDIVPEYFRCFWIRRMALDRRNFRLVVDTTLEIAVKVGGAEVIRRLIDGLKDESEPYRRMVVEAINNVATELGLSDIDAKLEERLIDGMLWAFQEHGSGTASDDSPVVLNALSTIIQKLCGRAKPYLKQIVSMVQWRLNNSRTRVREFAADLISKVAGVLQTCEEQDLMIHLSEVLFVFLGEEFPDVLGSILRALGSIVEVIGIEDMKPPINELLPRLTPILKNRHEKVQENCILLVGQIADRGAQFVSAREWMRICFELLDLLKAPRKVIRKSAVSTFGYIAKAIGPSDVLTTLLNNLKVQERTQRVCTTVAIAIVAEKCEPYTVVPALMNEYRIPEMNVQNGVLKSFSFLFEYIGDMSKDYIYAITPILQDALIDRDLVHRQTACSAVGHLALGVRGHGVEDALVHLLNHVWPNIFETSPHVVNSVMAAIEGCMVALGPGTILLYVLQGLFHPARKVRDVYWRIYNRLYVYGQDALVPYFPSIPSLEPHSALEAAPLQTESLTNASEISDPIEVGVDEDKYVRDELDLIL